MKSSLLSLSLLVGALSATGCTPRSENKIDTGGVVLSQPNAYTELLIVKGVVEKVCGLDQLSPQGGVSEGKSAITQRFISLKPGEKNISLKVAPLKDENGNEGKWHQVTIIMNGNIIAVLVMDKFTQHIPVGNYNFCVNNPHGKP